MTTYLITFDSKIDNSKLIDEIRTYDNWIELHDNVWGIVSDESSLFIFQHLAKHLNLESKMLFVKPGLYPDWKNADDRISSWLKKHL